MRVDLPPGTDRCELANLGVGLGMSLLMAALAHGNVGIVSTLSSMTPVVILPMIWARTGIVPPDGFSLQPGFSRVFFMRRIRIEIAYDGTAYYGWQVQPGLPTIQAVIEAVLSQIA